MDPAASEMDPGIVWRAFWGVAGGLWGARGRAGVGHWPPEGTAKAPLTALGRSWVSPGVSLGSPGPPFWPRALRPWCCSKMTVFISPLGPDPPPPEEFTKSVLEVPSGGPEMFLGLRGASAARFGDAFSLALGHWGR